MAVPVTFYTGAMQMFRDCRRTHLRFVVEIDDPAWSKTHLAAPDVIVEPQSEPEASLAVLANCHAVIFGVGTFGWWGAWLANAGPGPLPNCAHPPTNNHASSFTGAATLDGIRLRCGPGACAQLEQAPAPSSRDA
jgi:hypothetical protein